MEDIQLEKEFMSHLFNTADALKKVVEITKNKHIAFKENVYGKIFSALKQYYVSYGMVPAKETLKESITCMEANEKYKEELKILIDVLADQEISLEFPYCLKKMINHSMHLSMYTFLTRVFGDDKFDINKVDMKGVFDKLYEFLKKSEIQVDRDDIKSATLDSILLSTLADLEKPFELGIPTGIKPLDELTGGFRKGELVVVSSVSGGGKSIMLSNFSKFIYESGYNVLFITLEIPIEELAYRFLSLYSNFEYIKIRNKRLDQSEKNQIYAKVFETLVPEEDKTKVQGLMDLAQSEQKIKAFQSDFKVRPNKFKIYDVVKNCYISTIQELIESEKNIDVVILDHINLLMSDKPSGTHWYDQGNLARELKIFAKRNELLLITAAQLNYRDKERDPNDPVSLEDMRYSKMIAENADYVLGFNANKDDKLMGKIRINLAKSRFSKSIEIEVREVFSHMRIEDFENGDPEIQNQQ